MDWEAEAEAEWKSDECKANQNKNKKVESELYVLASYCVYIEDAINGLTQQSNRFRYGHELHEYLFVTHSLTRTQSTQQRSMEVFAIIWSGLIKQERLKRTDFKWQLSIIYCVYAVRACLCIHFIKAGQIQA